MGTARWNANEWKSYTRTAHVGKSTEQIYTSKTVEKELDAKNVKLRESRDSDLNPQSNAVIIALDVTGSMDPVLDAMARGMNTVCTEIYDRKPISDPHIMCMGIGDAASDSYPIQVTQFEADIRISKQLEKIYFERGGGGNMVESYNLAWYFAAMRTSIDCFEKRGKKGYLFTVGDEKMPDKLLKSHVKQFLGDTIDEDIETRYLLEMVSRTYEVFHIIVRQGYNFRRMPDECVRNWVELLGERALQLSDAKKLTEVIVSAIQINEGFSTEEVEKSWDGDTSMVVREAISGLTKSSKTTTEGVVRL